MSSAISSREEREEEGGREVLRIEKLTYAESDVTERGIPFQLVLWDAGPGYCRPDIRESEDELRAEYESIERIDEQ